MPKKRTYTYPCREGKREKIHVAPARKGEKNLFKESPAVLNYYTNCTGKKASEFQIEIRRKREGKREREKTSTK